MKLVQLCDLFTFHNNTQCHTHELLCCSCTIPDDLLSGDGELDVEDSDAIGDELGQANEAAHLGFQYASLYKPEISDKSDKAVCFFFLSFLDSTASFLKMINAACQKEESGTCISRRMDAYKLFYKSFETKHPRRSLAIHR